MTVYTSGTAKTYYYLTDQMRSVHALADEVGNILESYRFDAWGKVTGVYDGNGNHLSESAYGNRFLWQGREYSWKTGLYYFRARWYDPVMGRWLSNDPIGISGGLNQYVFCANNPVNFTDPFGLCADSRYNDRMAAISGAEALLESQHGAIFNFFARFLTGILQRGVGTAYQGELTGLSPNAAFNLAAVQVGGESAFVSATVQLGGMAVGQGLGSILALIPAAAGAGGGALLYGDNLRKTDLFHNFPYSFDSVIIQNGVRNVVSETYSVYTQPGSINRIQGVYEIGVNQAGVITHRMFSAGGCQ
jgi:RHS repeat-associated protein